MFHRWSSCAPILALGWMAAGGQVQGQAGPANPAAGTQSAETPVIRLTLSPARPAEPALKYLLLPGLAEQTPGNAEPMLYMTSTILRAHADYKQLSDKINSWLTMPAGQLPRAEVREFLAGVQTGLRYAELGARREYCHWDLPFRTEGVATELPPLADLRQAERALVLRARLAALEGRYDDALHDLQTATALGGYVGNGPTAINAMVGAAMLEVVSDELEEWSGAENSPSLYWALANLPRPSIDPLKGFPFERYCLFVDVPELARLEPDVLTAEQVSQILTRLVDLYKGAEALMPPELKDRAAADAAMARILPLSREYLLAHGRTKEQLDRLPPGQIVLIHSVERYRHWTQEYHKWFGLPLSQSVKGVEEAEVALERAGHDPAEGILIHTPPSLVQAFSRLAGVERKLAWLQFVEAVRIHAAAHGGQLPASPEALTEVPVPIDPVTGRGFAFTLESGVIKGELRGPIRVDGKLRDSARYELRPAGTH